MESQLPSEIRRQFCFLLRVYTPQKGACGTTFWPNKHFAFRLSRYSFHVEQETMNWHGGQELQGGLPPLQSCFLGWGRCVLGKNEQVWKDVCE